MNLDQEIGYGAHEYSYVCPVGTVFRSYLLFHPVVFETDKQGRINMLIGYIVLGILVFGLAWYLLYALVNPEKF